MKTRNKILFTGSILAAVFAAQMHAQLTVDGNFNVIQDQNTLDGVVFGGVFNGSSTIPATGAGIRFMWYPKKAAIRAGRVTGTHWNDGNIGDYSVALGYNTQARSAGSVALGHGATAWSGTGSVALGQSAGASGNGTFAAGEWAYAGGTGSVALGSSEIDGSAYSFAAGSANWIDWGRDRAVAIGSSNFVDADDAVAIGRGNSAWGNSAIALGRSLSSNTYAMLAVGHFNQTISSSGTIWQPNDPLFVIGNGTASNARSNAMVVRKNGDTDINGDLAVSGEVTITHVVPQGDILMGSFGN